MPKYEITTPNGRFEITVPEGTSEQQAYQYLQRQQQQPEPGVLPAAGRVIRGAGRFAAGGLADAYSLSDVPGVGALGPGTALRLSQKIPGGTDFRRRVEEFANAPMPTTAENVGWWGGAGLSSLGVPERVLPLGAAVRGIKAGSNYLIGKFAPKLKEVVEESARQTATQTGKKVGAEASEKVAEQAIKKPKLRMKADGSIVEVGPDGTERAVRQWTKRRMEKLGQRARGEPTSSTAPPTQEGVHQDYQDLLDRIGEHNVHHVAGYFANAMGIPKWTAHLIMMRGPRSVMDRGIATGAIGTGRILSGEAQKNERGNRAPEIPALPAPQTSQTTPR